MSIEVKVIEIGDSLGVLLPDEILTKFCLKDGDNVYLTDTAAGIQRYRLKTRALRSDEKQLSRS